MKLTKGTIIIGLGILSLCLGAAIGAYFAFAQSVPKLINYQGSLTDKDGNPITTEVPVRFSIYTQDIGGSPLWTETQIVTPQENGIFSVLLGSVEPFPDNLFKENPALYLGVQVGSDSEMTPRQQIVSAAYAIQSGSGGIEKGDYTALLTVQGGNNPTVNPTNVAGHYVRIGNIVHVFWEDAYLTITGDPESLIYTLPIPPVNDYYGGFGSLMHGYVGCNGKVHNGKAHFRKTDGTRFGGLAWTSGGFTYQIAE